MYSYSQAKKIKIQVEAKLEELKSKNIAVVHDAVMITFLDGEAANVQSMTDEEVDSVGLLKKGFKVVLVSNSSHDTIYTNSMDFCHAHKINIRL